jgi:outer membrane protein OmpA-like peptidoglycan-associated protein
MTGRDAVRPWAAPVALAVLCALALASGCQSLRGAHHPHRGPLVQAPVSCADFTISIYFEADSAALTPEARALISASADRTRGCTVTGINVVGLADEPGAPAANLAISKHRADAVIAALHRRGFSNLAFQTVAAGSAGAETGAGQAKPERRRADVAFHLAAEPPVVK